jgi:hypothetical protein
MSVGLGRDDIRALRRKTGPLLNVLEMCVEIEARQANVLARICEGPLITAADLKQEKVFPVPASARKPLPPDAPGMLTLT